LIRPLDRAQTFTGVSRGSFAWGSYGMATRRQGCVVAHLEYPLKMAIAVDPTVGSCSKVSTGCFTWCSYGMATLLRGCLVTHTSVLTQMRQNY
jgi:hypothetical protein